MALLLYNLFILLQGRVFRLASLWNAKAAQWKKGRLHWRDRLRSRLKPGEERIWIHVASLGEFEQARPLIEILKKDFPRYKILLTFFSPSGYEIRKHYELADYVCYLPEDTAANARDFIKLVKPACVLFIKYEFWHHYLNELKKNQVPVFLVAAAFMPEHVFFQWYGGFFREMLKAYTVLFVQDASNQSLLQNIGLSQQVIVSGDTRYDRVMDIAAQARTIPEVEAFRGDNKLLIAGSTWPRDEQLLMKCLERIPQHWKIILAPHDVKESHIRVLSDRLGKQAVCFSAFSTTPDAAERRVLIIDNIGMLSSLYAYGSLAYVGGGFAPRGLHNILEPAAFGNPVLFGPHYGNFVEALQFVKQQMAFPVADADAAWARWNEFANNPQHRDQLAERIRTHMQQHTGAARKVIQYLAQNKWL